MKKYKFLLGVLLVIGTVSIFLNGAFAEELFAPKEVLYEELEEGEIIPFDSKLSIDAFFPVGEVTENGDHYSSPGYLGGCVTRSGYEAMHLYYCKDENCLETEVYDKSHEVLYPTYKDSSLVFENQAELDVSNYQEVFGETDDTYIGWKVHFVDSGVLYWETSCGTVAYDIYRARRIGNYQNIVLTPVTQEYVDCVNRDDATVDHYLVKEIGIEDSSWYKDNVINDYEYLVDDKNITSWEKPARFSFTADKGDTLALTLRTDTSQFKITIDGKEQKLSSDFYNENEKIIGDEINPNRYYDYEFVIPSSGKHTFQIEYLGDAYLYFPYIYLKELKVLKPIAAEEVTEDEYTLEVKTCPNGYQVKGYYGERNDGNVDGNANDKVNTPNTLDTVWQYGLLLGFGSLFILVSYFVRKKVNS